MPAPDDTGYKQLIDDLDSLAAEAMNRQFDNNNKNTIYPDPKVALYRKLQAIAKKVMDGGYD